MFKLFSRSKQGAADFSFLKADMHSHLLPGIDDGAPDIETSLELIKGMMNMGYKKLITTPHVLWEMYPNTTEIIRSREKIVQDAVNAKGWEVEIKAAAEYFLDDHVAQLVKENQPLLTISGRMVLVEFSLAYPSHSLKDILFAMQMQDYQPVIAHPERYAYLEQNKAFYEELKDIGCLFQLNQLSLAGHYGRTVQELAQYLIKKGYYDLVGTDLHNRRHLEGLNQPAILSALQKLMDSGRLRNAEL